MGHPEACTQEALHLKLLNDERPGEERPRERGHHLDNPAPTAPS